MRGGARRSLASISTSQAGRCPKSSSVELTADVALGLHRAWLLRLLEEEESLTIEEANLAAACLAVLGGQSREETLGMLLAIAERAGRRRP
jgi:hypothetical protein